MIELDAYKEEARRRYLNIIFKPFDSRKVKLFEEIRKIVNYNGNIDEIIAYANYESKNKKSKYENYAILTKDTYFGVDIVGKTKTCRYEDIITIQEVKTSLFKAKVGIVRCTTKRDFVVSKSISEALTGFSIINQICNTDDKSFDKFLIGRTTKFFGEIAEWRLSDEQESSIKTSYHQRPEHFILYRLKLKELTLSYAEFQITIKDTDIFDSEKNTNGLFDKYEWGEAIERYNLDEKIKTIFQKSILDTVGVLYDLDDIYFSYKNKTTLLTRVNNAIDFANDMTDTIMYTNYRNMRNVEREYKNNKGE